MVILMDHRDHGRTGLMIAVLLALVTLAALWPALHNGFVGYDDPDYVTSNAAVMNGLTWEGVKWAFTTGHAGNWHPVTWLSHMLDCQFYGLKPSGHHLTSLLFHTASTLLLFGVLIRMTGSIWRSALVAALYGLHPMHIESVAWVAERKDVLSAFFFMAMLWAWTRYTEERSKIEGRGSKTGGDTKAAEDCRNPKTGPLKLTWYVVSVVLFALGLMSKPMLVTVPFVLLLLDFWPLQRLRRARFGLPERAEVSGESVRFLLLEKVPFFVLTLMSAVVTFIAQRSAGAVSSFSVLPLEFRISNAIVCYVTYVAKMFWPVHLAAFYPPPREYPFEWVAGAALLLVAVTVFVIWKAKRFPQYAVGWFWYLGMLVPVIGIVQVGQQAMADRYSYLPLIGLFMMVAWAGHKTGGSLQVQTAVKYGLAALCVASIAICVLLSRQQLLYWKNTTTLFEHALSVTTDNWVAHNNLGVALLEAGKVDEAEAHYKAAVSIQPRMAEAWANYGLLKAKQHDTEGAVQCYRQTLKLRPDHVDVRQKLGSLLVSLNRTEEGIAEFRLAEKLAPGNADAHFNLGAAFLAQNKAADAATEFAEACRIRPADLEARSNLAGALTAAGKYREAQIQLEQLLQVRPEPQWHYLLALVLDAQGETREAIPHYREAIRMNPKAPVYLNDLAWLLATSRLPETRDGGEAVRLAEQACALSGGKEARFWGTLDAAYAEAGRFEDAVKTAEKTRALALAAGQKELAGLAEQRAALYRSGKPYRNAPEEP